MKEVNLELCPLCGGVPKIYAHRFERYVHNVNPIIKYYSARIECTNCGASVSASDTKATDDLIGKKWAKEKVALNGIDGFS